MAYVHRGKNRHASSCRVARILHYKERTWRAFELFQPLTFRLIVIQQEQRVLASPIDIFLFFFTFFFDPIVAFSWQILTTLRSR